jgi:acyl-CoA thioesterase-1
MIGKTQHGKVFRSLQVGCVALLFNAVLMLASNQPGAEAATPVKLVAFGDSLTAGYLLPPDQSFPAQLDAALAAKGYTVEVTNAGVSGDTTAAGLERFDWAVPPGTDAVILELGANDALRGQSPADAKANLEQLISKLKARNIAVLLAGMRAPKNWGEAYASEFDGMYAEIAAKHDLILYPFFLDGVALDPSLNLDDGLHPNGKGVAEIVKRILPKVEDLLRRVNVARSSLQSKS